VASLHLSSIRFVRLAAVFFALFGWFSAFGQYEELESFSADTQKSVLRLSAANQAALQRYFDDMYLRIRLPTDPIEPPKVFLSAKRDAAAFVSPTIRKDVVFFNPTFLLTAPNADVIAFVFAHELTHFDKRQEAGRGTTDGDFLNEVDADIRGAAQRITKVGLLDDADKPRAAAYNLEAICDWLKAQDKFSASHPNSKNIGTVLAGLFVRERYRRKFPAVTKSKGPILPMTPAILAASAFVKKLEANPTDETVREKVKKEYRWFTEHPFKRAVRNLVWLEKNSATASQEEVWKVLNELGLDLRLLWVTDERSVRGDLQSYLTKQKLPADFFRRANVFIKDARDMEGWHYLGHYIEGLAKLEGLIDRLARGEEVATDVAFRDGTPEWVRSALILNNLGALKKRVKAQPLDVLTIISAGGPEVLKNKKAVELFNSAASKISLADIEKMVGNKKYGLDFFAALDAGPKMHRLPTELRRTLAERYSAEQDYRSSILKLMEFDPVLTREEMARRLKSERPGDVVWMEPLRATAQIPSAEMDKALADGLRRQIEIQSAKSINAGESLLGNLSETVRSVDSQSSAKTAALKTIFDYIAKAGPSSGVDVMGMSIYISPEALGFDPMHSRGDKANWLGRAIDFFSNELQVLKNIKPFFSQYPGGESVYPEAREAALEAVRRYPHVFLNNEMGVPWREVVPKLNTEQFLALLLTREVSNSRGDFPELAQELQRRFSELLSQKALPEDVEFAAFARIAQIVKGGSPASRRLLALVEERVRVANSRDATLKYLAAIPPQMFPTPAEYREFAGRLLDGEVERSRADLFRPSTRRAAIEALVNPVKQEIAATDPAVRMLLLDHLAEKTQASPDEKPYFQVAIDEHQQAGKVAQYANAILEAYENLPPPLRWRFLQFLRGKSDALFLDPAQPSVFRRALEALDNFLGFNEMIGKMRGEYRSSMQSERQEYERSETNFRWVISRALRRGNIFVPAADIESYVRFHFKGISPLARGVFFQVALEGKAGLLNERGFKRRILNELINSMPEEIRPVVRRLHTAAVRALPPAYENLILAVAFSESGSSGSPEVALRTIFQNMGPLVQKFGQALAFDQRLPENYRKELMKLWDEGPSPGWWPVSEFIRRQYGDIWAAGFRVFKIRNSGTTEIVVELEAPDGGRRIVAVQREALEVSSEVDGQDLKNFVAELSRGWGNDKKWGWMNVLVRDAAKTMELEMDSKHKRQITSEMHDAYSRAAQRLGGRAANGKPARLLNMTLRTVKYEDHPLPDGKNLVTQNLAPGVPLKNIESSHPALYREINEWLVLLENEVQNDPASPVDKDRMPGQVLVDISDPKDIEVTLLDFGQAKRISAKVFKMRDHFIGAALAANGLQVGKSLETLNVVLTGSQQRALAAELRSVETPYRPLQGLEWLHRNGLAEKEKLGDMYDDLTHAIRAKIRLGQWEQSIGVNIIKAEWTELGRRHHALGKFLAPSSDPCVNKYRQMSDQHPPQE
jgi:hypothetical protein